MVPDHRIDGAIQGVYVVGHDITDLKVAQDALAARESQLRAIMDGVPAPVAYIDRDARCHYVNRALLQYFGLAAEQVASLRLHDVVGPDIHESARAMISRALDGESTAFDRLVPGANGVSRWMTIRVVPDALPSGEVPGAFVLMTDIHGLKQAQEALRASESELRLIMDNVPARVAYIDRDYRYRFLNRHDEEWLGLGRDELTDRPVAEVVGDARFRQLQPMLERVLPARSSRPSRCSRSPPARIAGSRPLRAEPRRRRPRDRHLRGPHRRSRAEAQRGGAAARELDAVVAHRQHAARGAGVGSGLRGSCDGRRRPSASSAGARKKCSGMPIDANPLIHEADRDDVAELLARLMSGEAPRSTGQTRNSRKDGETIWCEWYHSCLLDDHGNIVSILSFVQDVSTRIQAEERLQHMATRDALTGLPNRVLLHERLVQAIAQAKRTARRVGVLFIDLDRFKNVNDTLGHRIGDELLKAVSRALSRRAARRSTCSRDSAATSSW